MNNNKKEQLLQINHNFVSFSQMFFFLISQSIGIAALVNAFLNNIQQTNMCIQMSEKRREK